jgi:hypothetical protein
MRSAVKRLRLQNVACLDLEVTPATVSLLPSTDAVVFLSVWHHMVRHLGLAGASDVLGQLWAGTRQLLFFDTGELEMPARYRLPDMSPNPRRYLHTYLAEQCPDGRVEHLGQHAAFTPQGRPCLRNLFVVVRE